MMSQKISICKKHTQPFTYYGDECPWCAFAAEVVRKLQTEYERGFGDGVAAADSEYNKKKEAELNAKRSDDRKGSAKVDKAVSGDVLQK